MTAPSSFSASSSGPGDETSEIRVYHAHVSDVWTDPARVARALDWLDAPEAARFGRFRLDVDRQMFLLGRVMARALVSRALGVGPMDWRWREGPHGRPEIAAPETPMHFNIAHSAGVVACAIGVDREVGVDVEDLRRRPTAREVVDRYCAPGEIADIDAQPEATWRDRFLAYWTLKEAYLKARGLGIALPLADIRFVLDRDIRVEFSGELTGTDTRWHFEMTRVGDRHLLAIAVPVLHSSDRPRVAVSAFPLALLP
jgi:4'-phosphopantetheinyl transferase